MEIQKFIRKPFTVDCVQVTEENMKEVEAWCNGSIHQTDAGIAEKFNKPVQKWIQIEVQHAMNERQTKAFVGDWVLFANRGFKIYTAKAFERNFESPFQGERPEAKIHMDDKPKPTAPPGVKVVQKGSGVEAIVPANEVVGEFVHEHLMGVKCDEAGCSTDRYVDGTHVFLDKTVIATPQGYTEVVKVVRSETPRDADPS